MNAIAAKNAFQATARLISDLRPYLTSRRTVVSAALSTTAAGIYALSRFPISAILALIDSRPLPFLVVLSLIICYRSVTRPAAAHGALPEGMSGIWSPITLHAFRIFFSPEPQVQWFGYMLYFKGFCGPEPPGKVALQLNDNPDNIFNHMIMTELSNANPKHKGGFTQILGTKKIQQTPFEHQLVGECYVRGIMD